jgi:MFS family permease
MRSGAASVGSPVGRGCSQLGRYFRVADHLVLALSTSLDCVFLIPSQIILTYVRPSLWLPGLELGWGVLTGLLAMTTSAKQVYALRTFIGVLESSAYPGIVTLLMLWYTPRELAKRIGFYHSCQSIGSMVSGGLTAAVASSMHNYMGLASWRWLFIVNAIMTIFLGFFGFVSSPPPLSQEGCSIHHHNAI